jgi:hypothetical protein
MLIEPNNRAMKDVWIEFFTGRDIKNPYAVTLQLKTHDKIKAVKEIGHFKNRYRRKIKKRTQKINFIPVLEIFGHLHAHLVVSRPDELAHGKFIAAVKDAWNMEGVWDNRNRVKDAETVGGWFEYITKFDSHKDEVDIQNLEFEIQ